MKFPKIEKLFPKLSDRLLHVSILFGVSAYVSWRLFHFDYNSRMESIEGAFIGISQHILNNWRDLAWWPAWYGGIPFRNAYQPLLHVAVAAMAAFAHIPVARAHHLVAALFFCGGPVFAYLMMARLSKLPFQSFCAALLYSVFSPCSFLVPAITAEEGHPLNLRRLTTLVFFGEAPHIAGLALVPLAVYFLDVSLSKRTPLSLAVASAGFVAVVYTNWLAAVALAAMIVCYLVAAQPWRNWILTAEVVLVSYLVALPWIPPSLLGTIEFNARTSGADFSRATETLLHIAPVALAAFIGIKLLLRFLGTPPYLQMMVLFTFLMASISLGYCWFGKALLPQANRYVLEFDLGIDFLLVMSAGLALNRLPRTVRVSAVALVVLFCMAQAGRAHDYALRSIHSIDITKTLEYETARWFDAHLKAGRVMTGGTTEFWMQAFTETPQLCGGYEQGVENYMTRIARYQILSGAGAGDRYVNISVLWLKAFGVSAIAAGGPATREYYHSFARGEQFRGALPELWRNGDDAIYRVPLRSPSLAHVIDPKQLVRRPPANGIDVEQIRRYVAAIDDPSFPEPRFAWRTLHSAEILSFVKPGQIVSVQITYDPGWRAIVNGRAAPVFRDGLGLLAIQPRCNGECRIKIEYDGGAGQTACRWLSGASVIGWIVWAAGPVLRRRTAMGLIAVLFAMCTNLTAAQTLTVVPVGAMHVERDSLVDSIGQTVVLKGTEIPGPESVSPGPGEFSPFSATTFSTLRQRWNMNTIRIAVDSRRYLESVRYRGEILDGLRTATSLGLVAIIGVARTEQTPAPQFWTTCASDFKDNPHVLFAAPGASAVQLIRAQGATQPILLPETTQDIGLAREVFTGSTSASSPGKNGIPELVRFADSKLLHTARSSQPVDPSWLENELADELAVLDTRGISWIVSSFRPGGLIADYRNYEATALENGDGRDLHSSFQGIGMIVQFHLWSTKIRGLFTVNGQTGNFVLPRGGLAIAYGPTMATAGAGSIGNPRLRLGGISVRVIDSRGTSRLAGLLYVLAGWGQVNFIVPSNCAAGPAEIDILRSDGTVATGTAVIAGVAPGFSAEGGNGRGPATGEVIQRLAGGAVREFPAGGCKTSRCWTNPIRVSSGVRTEVRLVGNGFRNARSAPDIEVRIGGVRVPVLSYGPFRDPGLDEVRVQLPGQLRGLGESDVIATVNGQFSNPVRIRTQ